MLVHESKFQLKRSTTACRSSQRDKTAYEGQFNERQQNLAPEAAQRLRSTAECIRGAMLSWYEHDVAAKAVNQRVKAIMLAADFRRNERRRLVKGAAGAASSRQHWCRHCSTLEEVFHGS